MSTTKRKTRISGYCICAPLVDDSKWVVLHGYTGAMDIVSSTIGSWLLQNRGQVVQQIPEEAGGYTSHFEQQGYFTALSQSQEVEVVKEIASVLHERELENSPIAFLLIPSYGCNLRCPYCYQSHQMHAGKGKFASVMSPEQVDQFFMIMERLSEAGSLANNLRAARLERQEGVKRPKKIGLFGGEPLTAATLPIIDYIVQQARRRDIRIHAVTNGVDLQLFQKLLGPSGIEFVQITLDGPPALHNERRVGPKLRNTFDQIASNIDLALLREVSVQVRVNVDRKNIGALSELYQVFAERGWNDHQNFQSYAAPVVAAGSIKENFDPAKLALATAQGCGIQSEERRAREVLRQCLQKTRYPFQSVTYCAAERGMLIFDCLGDVYTCWEEVGEVENRVATYDASGVSFLSNYINQWLSRFPGAIEECSQCPYALIHTSGCAKHAKIDSGTLMASSCASFQKYFPTVFAREFQKMRAVEEEPEGKWLPLVEYRREGSCQKQRS